MGRYHPPASLDSSLASDQTGGFNSQGHPLGRRARNLGTDGSLTVRFETPFKIICETCNPDFNIDQGVRFNAEKKRIGHYLSTPIFEFRFKHKPCGGTIVIKTDPKNTEYLVTEGGRRQYAAENRKLDANFPELLTEEERERRRQNAMANLEGIAQQKEKVTTEATRIQELQELQNKRFDDDYGSNQLLRKRFREEKSVRQAKEKQSRELSERLGIGFEIPDETQEDRDRAAQITFGKEEDEASIFAKVNRQPMFVSKKAELPAEKPAGMLGSEWKRLQARTLFQNGLIASQNVARDPFLNPTPRKPITIGGLKRVRHMPLQAKGEETAEEEEPPKKMMALVAYSDSEDE